MRARSFAALAPLGIALGLAAACADSSGSPPSGDAPAPTSSVPPAPTTTATTPPAASDECAIGASRCTAKDRVRLCEKTPDGNRWVEQTCAVGSGCWQGACKPGACSDECTLGDSSSGKSCAPWDVTKGAAAPALDAAAKMHDRSRAYLGWMRRGPMLADGIGSPRYSDPPTYSVLTYMDGIGDSAIWTGSYLAAEAWRLAATGSADARARVRALVQTLHLWMNVSGEPGVLARWVKESNKTYPFTVGDLKCGTGDRRSHCNVSHAGKSYDYIGHISRDQYQGVMLGYATAYEALGSEDEDVREMIREDAVELVEELMKERTVPVKVKVDNVDVTVPPIKLRFAVVSPREMDAGAISFSVSGGTPDDAEMWGFQEFMPNLAHLVRQIPILSFVPDIPRASSAIMLASFFRVALAVTDGVPKYATRRSAIESYYIGSTGPGGNVNDWLAIAKTFSPSQNCGGNYYGNNITWQPMYNLARLETAGAYKSQVQDDLLKQKLWPPFATHKNSFFAFIYAANVPGGDASVAATAATQLAQFPPPPRVNRAVDLLSSPKYPNKDPSCPNQSVQTEAVDVGERPTGDFLWQRHPWGLYADGDPGQVQPGVDYLAAYWLGRRHALLDEDTPSVCLAWQ